MSTLHYLPQKEKEPFQEPHDAFKNDQAFIL